VHVQNKFCIGWGQVTMYTKAGVSEHGSAWDKISSFFFRSWHKPWSARQASELLTDNRCGASLPHHYATI